MSNDEEWVPAHPVPSFISERKTPYLYRYIQIHGLRAVMPTYPSGLGIPIFPYQDREEVYRDCIRKRCTWQELLNYKEPPDNTVI